MAVGGSFCPYLLNKKMGGVLGPIFFFGVGAKFFVYFVFLENKKYFNLFFFFLGGGVNYFFYCGGVAKFFWFRKNMTGGRTHRHYSNLI